MTQLLLWSNMIGFTLMFASAALVWLEYVKQREAWLRDYLLYQACHAIWTLFAAYVFFESVFLPTPIPWLALVFGYVRIVVSLGIAFFGLMFYLRVAGFDRLASLWVSLAVLTLVFLMVGVSMLFQIAFLAAASTILFYLCFTAASWVASASLMRSGAGLRKEMLPFVVFTTVAYAVLGGANAWFLANPGPGNFLSRNVLAQGAFVIIWSVIVGTTFLRRAGLAAGEADTISKAFVKDYGITNREAEIIEELARGSTSKQIGEKLFISQRTVETHIYNVYRKCSVVNRVELLRLMKRY